jgi:phosphoglycolate phosphatase-like HAD superfamily hydrolase
MKIFGTDYDGVIINIEPQKATAFGSLLNKEWGVDKNEAENLWHATGGTSRRYKFDYCFKKQFNKNLTDEEYMVIGEKFGSLLRKEYYPKLELLPGALDLLKFAKKNFDFTFVSSGVPMKEIQYLVNINELSEYFNLVLGTDNTYKTKNDHFQRIIAEQKPELIIYIADGPEDMRIAKEFELVKAIGVATNHSKEELLNAGAKNVVNNLDEGLLLIKSLISSQNILEN